MQPTSHKKLYFLIAGIVLLVILLVVVFHFFGAKSLLMNKSDSTDSFFDSQSAMVLGKVTAVGNDMITIENRKGVRREFPVSKTLTILTVDEKGMATTSSDLKKIETGKTFSLNLASGMEGTLEVTNIMPDLTTAPAMVPPPAPNAVISPAPVALPPAASPAASSRATAPTPVPDEDEE